MLTRQDRDAIDGLFERLEDAERRGGPRDADAEALIREKIAKKESAFEGPITVYGEQSRITAPTLDREGVTFKQTPYDVKARR